MALPSPKHLSLVQIKEVLGHSPPGQAVQVRRMRSHNKSEISQLVPMSTEELKNLVVSSFEEGHQPGGDLEVLVPKIDQRLVGHHDGVYWLESN